MHAVKRHAVDQRAHQRAFGARVAHLHVAVHLDELGHELVVHAVVHKQAAQRGAALACCAHGRKGNAAQRQVQIGRGGDDGGVVSTQLQNGAGKAGCEARAYSAAHGGGACGRQHGHAGVVHQHLANVALADDQFQQARGRVAAKTGQRTLGDGMRGQGGERGFFRRLPHHRVATHHGQCGVPRPHGHGEVEGRDHAAHAQRVPGFHHAVTRALGGDGQPMQLPRETHGEVADVDHLLHLALALRGALAHLEGDQLSEQGFVGAQLLADQAHQFATAWRRDLTPGQECLAGLADHGCNVRGLLQGQLSHHLTGDGRAHAQTACLAILGGRNTQGPHQTIELLGGWRKAGGKGW